MPHPIIETIFNDLLVRKISGGGFVNCNQGVYRPDATAWAILALEAWGYDSSFLQSSRDRLAADQERDGRVSLSINQEAVYWPTPLAILAWRSSPGHDRFLSRATKFLLNVSGLHFPLNPKMPVSHNTNLRGWPWIEGTHSWTDPTSLAVIALKVAGFSDHKRVLEANKMILDRQLPSGGWNYGNVLVFGQELRPLPESTGLALSALSGQVPRERVERSLQYLMARTPTLKSPRSLSWCLMAQGAWALRSETAEELIFATISSKDRYGGFDTESLALMLLSLKADRGFLSLFGT